MKNQRILYIDLLRIFAMFSVILFHVAIYNNNFPPFSFGLVLTQFFDATVRYPVPVFFMISGALFLQDERNITVKSIFRKYIPHIFIAFMFWASIYTLLFNIVGIVPNIKNKWNYFIGDRHFWFVFTLLGIYMATPLLRIITKDNNKKLLEYFLLLSLTTTSIIPAFISFFDVGGGVRIIVDRINLSLFSNYIFFFISGYYFFTFDLSSKKYFILYVCGILSFVITAFVPYLKIYLSDTKSISLFHLNINLEHGLSYLYNYTSINVTFITISIFLFFKNNISKIRPNETLTKLVNIIASYSFGIYFIHYLFMLVFHQLGFTNSFLNPAVSILLKVSLIFSLSFITVYFLSKIPIIKKVVL